jgi:hypothetical protein
MATCFVNSFCTRTHEEACGKHGAYPAQAGGVVSEHRGKGSCEIELEQRQPIGPAAIGQEVRRPATWRRGHNRHRLSQGWVAKRRGLELGLESVIPFCGLENGHIHTVGRRGGRGLWGPTASRRRHGPGDLGVSPPLHQSRGALDRGAGQGPRMGRGRRGAGGGSCTHSCPAPPGCRGRPAARRR